LLKFKVELITGVSNAQGYQRPLFILRLHNSCPFLQIERENHIAKEAATKRYVWKENEIANFWIVVVPDTVHKNVDGFVSKDSLILELTEYFEQLWYSSFFSEKIQFQDFDFHILCAICLRFAFLKIFIKFFLKAFWRVFFI